MASTARSAVVSRLVPRKPSKPKKGEPFRMHIILPGELVNDIDEIARERMGKERGVEITRTEIARVAIYEYVDRHKRAATAAREEQDEVHREAKRLAAAWVRIAKPAELRKLARIAGDRDSFSGIPNATHPGWWAQLVLELPSLKGVSFEPSGFTYDRNDEDRETYALPDVDGDVRALLDDEDTLRDFCEAFVDAADAISDAE